ncbi:MAG: FIST N-terminal domain-containing protein [Kofleriaceae bacterium]
MTHVTLGFSIKADVDRAVAEAVPLVAGPAPVLALVYVGVAYDAELVLAALAERLPAGTPVRGASTQGVTLPGRSYESDRFLAVMLLHSDTVTVRTAEVDVLAPDPRAAGAALAAQLGPPPAGPSTTLLMYDPLGGADVTQLLAGLADGGYPRLYGGASGQPWGQMVRTYQLVGRRAYTSGALAIALDGLTPVGELTHGAEGIGLELVATRTDGNQVVELDGRPALDVWCEQLGVAAVRDVENTANWALGVRPPAGTSYEGLVTRAPFGFDVDARTLVFQAPIATGATVQVCVRTQQAVMGGAAAMAQRLAAALAGRTPVVALSFECGARPAPFLGAEDAAAEVVGIQAILPAGLPWFGMYAWGEIAPVGEHTEFHNYTFPLCVLCEGPTPA